MQKNIDHYLSNGRDGHKKYIGYFFKKELSLEYFEKTLLCKNLHN